MNQARTIVLVTHQPFLREVLAQIISAESQGTLHVVGASDWNPAGLAALGPAQPDVVVAVVGYTIRDELQALAALRRHAPGCRVLVIDTLVDARTRASADWGEADILLLPEQVLSSLVPAIRRLTSAAAMRA